MGKSSNIRFQSQKFKIVEKNLLIEKRSISMKYLLMIASVGLCLLVGCSSLDVTTDFDPEIDFNAYITYAWYTGEMPEGDARRG